MTGSLTLDQIRDRIAGMVGIERFSSAAVPGPVTWALKGHNTLHRWDHHPIPPSLDWLVRVWGALRPCGYEWKRGNDEMWLSSTGSRAHNIYVKITNSFLDDWTLLLADTLVWLQSNDLPAFTAAINKIRKEVR